MWHLPSPKKTFETRWTKKTISKPYKSLGDSNPNNRPLADDSWSQNKPEPQISRKRHVDTSRRRHKPTPVGRMEWSDWWIVRPMAVAKRARKSLGDPEGCETVTPQSRRCFDPKFSNFPGQEQEQLTRRCYKVDVRDVVVDVRGWCFLHRDCYPSSLKVENYGDLKMVEEKYLEKKENNNWFEDVWIFVIELDFGVGWCLKYEFLCICGWYGGG